MTTISYDRYALGIVMKDQWTDADDLAQVGVAVGKLNMVGIAYDLPAGDNSGVAALRVALFLFLYFIISAVL